MRFSRVDRLPFKKNKQTEKKPNEILFFRRKRHLELIEGLVWRMAYFPPGSSAEEAEMPTHILELRKATQSPRA